MSKVAKQETQVSIVTSKDTVSKPSVTLHKRGRYVLVKPNDTISADIVREVNERKLVPAMRSTDFYSVGGTNARFNEEKHIYMYNWLEIGIESHPIVLILKSYGLDVTISPTLSNYMKKEARRQKIENAPYPVPPIANTVSLFDRACEGLILMCTKDFRPPGAEILFHKGNRYMVVATGGEGRDVITLCTNPVSSYAVLSLVGNGAKHEWTSFHEDMEKYFSDSESTELEKPINEVYPERVKAMSDRLKAMKLPLYEHVEVDASMMALKRGVINGYPMRMAKTSCGIAVAELSRSTKVGVVSPGNARIFWSKEFERLGFKEDVDFTEVRSFADLEKPTKYHLTTYNWLIQKKDPAKDARADYDNLLKPSVKTIRRKIKDSTKTEEIGIDLVNPCPHCKKSMERYVWSEALRTYQWTTRRGFMCRNTECVWTTNNHLAKNRKKKKGAAWFVDDKIRGIVTHKGGYIDTDLALHVRTCEDEKVSGRQCPTCKVVDSAWEPPRYKRLKKKFTHVILDEAHAVKNHTSESAKAALNLRARRKQALTGTLISNSPMDAYWPLHWTQNAPTNAFPYLRTAGFREFDEKFCGQIHIERPVGTELDAQGNQVDIIKTVRKRIPFLKNPPEFWKFIAPKMRRRTYQDPLFLKTLEEAGRSMPEVHVNKVPVPMDGYQAELLLASIKDFKAAFDSMKKEAESSGQMLNMAKIQNMSQMVTMRILATCPEKMNEKFNHEVYSGPAGGGKMRYIKSIVQDRLGKGGKVLILSDFRKMQDTCAEQLKSLAEVIKFDTSWDDDERREAFEEFQLNDKKRIFIAGTRAVREGVDLSAADTCICTDLLWSPAFQMQAWSRIMAPATRERLCEVFIVLSQDSIDEHIYNVFYSKMVAAEQAMDRKVINRRAQEIDVRWFVDRILEAEQVLAVYVRDGGHSTFLSEKLDLSFYEDREG